MRAILSLRYKNLILTVFVIAIFLSTGGVIDLLIAGADVRDLTTRSDENNSNLRLILWLPVYLSITILILKHFKSIQSFLETNKLVLLLLSLIFCSALWADGWWFSLYSALQFVILTLFAIIIGRKFELFDVFKVVYRLLQIIVLLSLFYVFLLPEYGTSVYVGEVAFRGVFTEKNKLGQALVYFFVLSFAYLRCRVFDLVTLFAAFLLLIGNGSATALVLSLLVPFLYKGTRFFYGSDRTVHLNALLVSGLSLGIGVLIAFGYEPILQILGKDPTLTGRTDLWRLGMLAFTERPILGFGYNSFWSSSHLYGGEYVTRVLPWGPMSMHNGWFEVLLQIGLIGFIVTALIFFRTVGLVIAHINSVNNARYARCLLVFMIVYLVWTLMQHMILRHQEYNHILFIVVLSSLSKRHSISNRARRLKIS